MLGIKESAEEKSHASLLTVFIRDLLKESGTEAGQLDAVAVSKGPGSYTGLRIGVSAAKGIAYGAGIPLIAIASTRIMFHGALETGKYDYYCPMIDARRMEVYSAVFNNKGEEIKEISAEIISKDSFAEIMDKGKVLFFGDGAAKCSNIIIHPSASFDLSFSISSGYMCHPAAVAFRNKAFEDVAYFEPFYLKDFIATIPRKNILGRKK